MTTFNLLVTGGPHGDIPVSDTDIVRAREAARAFGIEWRSDLDTPFTFSRQLTNSAHALILAAYLTRTGWMPEDPLLVKARKIAIQAAGDAWSESMRTKVLAGEVDDGLVIKAAYAALKEASK